MAGHEIGHMTNTAYVHDDEDPTGNPVDTGERALDLPGRLTSLDWTYLPPEIYPATMRFPTGRGMAQETLKDEADKAFG